MPPASLRSAALPHPCMDVPTGFPEEVVWIGAAHALLPAAVHFCFTAN